MILIIDDTGTIGTPLEQVRAFRDAQLQASDWTQTNDAPVDQQAWKIYRQALRDFPATWEPSETAEFPDPPA